MTGLSNATSDKPVPPEELIALGDEMAALVRAGVPLELGLRELGRDAQGTLGRISRELAERMSRGESLPDALAAGGDRVPRLYRSLVEAGLKAGRLPAALEAISAFTWELLEFRRKIALAAVYPFTVLALAYGLFLVFLAEFVSRYELMYVSFRLPMSSSLRTLVTLRASMASWAWIPPAILLLLIAWWFIAGRRRVTRLCGFPVLGAKNFRFAMFADLLAMQVDHAIPLGEGIVLAAEVTGSSAMREAAKSMARQIEQGERPGRRPARGGAFPPFLQWLMARGQQQGQLAQSLRLAADMYRRRAVIQLRWFQVLFPALTALVVGGGATLFYALGLFLPFVNMLYDLGGVDISPFG